jgi:hypothetical protein
MNAREHDIGGPILPGSALAQVLDDYPVPGLSAGFADRVLAAAETRPAPLPELRRPSGGRGWQLGRRIAIGVASFGALATAAAATGLLEQFDIPVPSAEKVWASLTGKEPVAAAAVPVVSKPVANEPATLAPVEIVGPIDTPEELGEAFRRIDEVRQGRSAMRRELIDQRIDKAIERRRAAGLPVPTAEEEAQLRDRIDQAQARRQQLADERVQLRREEMARKVESGEALTREDVLRPLREDARALELRERLERLRQMSPQQRREALRRLPLEQRRALIEEYRTRRGEAATPAPEAAPLAPETTEMPEPQSEPTAN